MPINLINDDSGIAFELSLLLLISRKKFVVVWNLSFQKKEDMKKENLTTCYI